jgi:hypothetical protein
MRTFYVFNLCVLSLALSACQPKQQTAAEQQQFICHTLIDGFLKTQALTEYRFHQVQPLTQSSVHAQIYTYTAQHNNRLYALTQQAKLQFNCQKLSARKFQIKLHHPQAEIVDSAVLLQIVLPEEKATEYMTYTHSLSKFAFLK